jgi:Holliday junction resolvasome RuvABC endonuclease subunit
MQSTILGLDLADRLGLSIIEVNSGQLLFSETRKLSKGDPQQRVLNLRNLLLSVLEKFNPIEVAIEDVFLPAKT